MTIKDIVIAYCIVHYPDADGLCNEDCGCSFEDPQLCSGWCMDCKPAKWNAEDDIFEEIKQG